MHLNTNLQKTVIVDLRKNHPVFVRILAVIEFVGFSANSHKTYLKAQNSFCSGVRVLWRLA